MEATSLQSQVDTLLIVDDEPLMTDLFRQYMTRRGFHVLTASAGAEAIEMLKPVLDTVRLVITDMTLPGMDGLAIARAVEALNPRMPVLMATGHDRTGITFPPNVVGVVQKPYQNRALAEQIRKIIDAHQSTDSAEMTVL